MSGCCPSAPALKRRAGKLSRGPLSLAFVKGDHEAVRRYGDAGLPVLRRLGDSVVLAGTLGIMGNSALALGDFDRAGALTAEAVEVGRRSGDLMTASYAHYCAGVVFAWHGELDEGRAPDRGERARGPSARERPQRRELDKGARRDCAGSKRPRAGTPPLRGEPRAASHTRRSLGDLPLAHQPCAYIREERSRHGVAPGRGERRDRAEDRATGQVSSSTSRFAPGWPLRRIASERAVRLYAYASTLRGSVGTHPSEVAWPDPAQQIDHLRTVLGEEAFADAWARDAR